MSYIDHLKNATAAAPFVTAASVTIDMSHVTPRIRTLAKKIVVSRRFDMWSRSKSHILAYSVFKAFAPADTAAMVTTQRLSGYTPSDSFLTEYRELVQADEMMSRLKYTWGRNRTIEEVVDDSVYTLLDRGILHYVDKSLDPRMTELVDSIIKADPEVTNLMCKAIDSKTLAFPVVLTDGEI
jgi:hypothetical protein